MKCSAPCSAVLRHCPSSWAAVVHRSALIPKALRSSRKHPIHSFSCPPHTARAPHQFSEHHTLWQSRVLHARHKSREQDPPPEYNRLDVLTSHLHERSQIGNRVAGAIVLSPTDAARQEGVVCSRVRAPRDAVVQHCLALSIRILSSRGALGRSYSSRMYFWKQLDALRMHRSTSMDRSALWSTFPPRYTNPFVWLYTWPAVSTLNMVVASGIPFVR